MAQKLSLVARMGAGIKAFGAGFGAGISTFQPYEGAGFSRKRPVIYGAHARDSRLDLNEATRVELLKLARHMYRNVGLIRRGGFHRHLQHRPWTAPAVPR